MPRILRLPNTGLCHTQYFDLWFSQRLPYSNYREVFLPWGLCDKIHGGLDTVTSRSQVTCVSDLGWTAQVYMFLQNFSTSVTLYDKRSPDAKNIMRKNVHFHFFFLNPTYKSLKHDDRNLLLLFPTFLETYFSRYTIILTIIKRWQTAFPSV